MYINNDRTTEPHIRGPYDAAACMILGRGWTEPTSANPSSEVIPGAGLWLFLRW